MKYYLLLAISFIAVSCTLSQMESAEVSTTTFESERTVIATETKTRISPTATTTDDQSGKSLVGHLPTATIGSSPTQKVNPTTTPEPQKIIGYLPDGVLFSLGRGMIFDIAVSLEEEMIAIGSVGGTYILGGNSYNELGFIPAETENHLIYTLDFSPDGTYLVTGSTFRNLGNNYVSLYQTTDFQLVDQLVIPRRVDWEDAFVKFSPVEPLVAVLSGKGNVNTWNIESGEWQFVDAGNSAITFTPNGLLIIANYSRILSIDTNSGQIIKQYQTPFDRLVKGVVVSHNGRLMAGYQSNAHQEFRIAVWEIESGEILVQDEELDLQIFEAPDILFSEDDQTVYLAHKGGIASWDIPSGSRDDTLVGNTTGRDRYFLETALIDGERMVGSSVAQELVVWQLPNGNILHSSVNFSPEPGITFFSPDGTVFTVNADLKRIFDAKTGEQIDENKRYSPFEFSPSEISCLGPNYLRLSPNGDQYWDTNNGYLIIKNIINCSTAHSFQQADDHFEFAISWNWEYVFEGTESGTVNVYDLNSEELIREFSGFSAPVRRMVLSSDGKYFAASINPYHGDRTLIFDMETGDRIASIPSNLRYNNSIIDHHVYTFDRIWDIDTGETVTFLSALTSSGKIGNQSIEDEEISPDGKLLAIVGKEVTQNGELIIHILDIETGSMLHRYIGHSIYQFLNVNLYFSSDSQRLFSVSDDGSVLVWDTSH